MPSLLLAMFFIALFGIDAGRATVPGQLWYGFTAAISTGYFWHLAIMGVFSTGTGLFGTLIYLDRRENTFTVPANRSSSIIAGVIATYALSFFYGQRMPSTYQLIGVALILAAIVFLAYRAMIEKRQKVTAQVAEKCSETEVSTQRNTSTAAIKMQPVTEAE